MFFIIVMNYECRVACGIISFNRMIRMARWALELSGLAYDKHGQQNFFETNDKKKKKHSTNIDFYLSRLIIVLMMQEVYRINSFLCSLFVSDRHWLRDTIKLNSNQLLCLLLVSHIDWKGFAYNRHKFELHL